MSTSAQELNKVRLEPRVKGKAKSVEESTEDEDSELESAPSDEDPDMEIDYEVDAIKWAKYRDSHRDRQDGFKGWHYGVMWKGFLKTGSETEEPLASFEIDNGDTPLVDEFWKAVGRPTAKGKKEPKGTRLGEVIETPKPTMKRWLKSCGRNYHIYQRRRQKELRREKFPADAIPEDLLITKADSDYYWNKKKRRERMKRKLAEGKIVSAARSASRSASNVPTNVPARAGSEAGPSSRALAPRARSRSSSLGSMFDSDREGVSMDLDAVTDSEEEKEVIEVPSQSKSSASKRKQMTPSPDVSTAILEQKNPAHKKTKIDERPEKVKVKLANIGKIPKHSASSAPVAPIPSMTFGNLEPGIFDPAPASTVTASDATAPMPGVVEKSLDPVQPSIAPSTNKLIPPSSTSDTTTGPSPGAAVPSSTSAVTALPARQVPAASVRTPAQRPSAPAKPVNPVTQALSAIRTALPAPLATPAPLALDTSRAVASRPPPPVLTSAPAVQPTNRPPPTPISAPISFAQGPALSFRPAPVAPSSRPTPVPERKPPSLPVRPKYVQPSKIQILNNVVDPLAARKLARNGIHDPHVVVSPSAGSVGSAPMYASPPNGPCHPVTKSSAFVPRQQSMPSISQQMQPAPPSGPAPPGPPTGPKADRDKAGEAYGHRQTGALPDQKAIYRGEVAPWQQRQQGGSGHLSPMGYAQPPSGSGHVSPHQYGEAAGHISPNQYINPSGHLSPRLDTSSPSLPSAPFAAPVQIASYTAAKDPRLRAQQAAASTSVSPAQAATSLPTPASATFSNAEQSRQVSRSPLPDESLRPVESKGGLVTVSPLLMLRSPEKFRRVMDLLRTSPEWGAYIIPSALIAVDKSWPLLDLCPDPTAAHSTLITYLPLDDTLRHFTGAVISGSGLAISCCPPSPYAGDACVQWKRWLSDIAMTTEYPELICCCKGVRAGYFERLAQQQRNGQSPAQDDDGGKPDLSDVELAQVEDMSRMRARKDVMKYTRFVYVGENGLSMEIKNGVGAGIEFFSPDVFATLLEFEAA